LSISFTLLIVSVFKDCLSKNSLNSFMAAGVGSLYKLTDLPSFTESTFGKSLCIISSVASILPVRPLLTALAK